MPLYRGNGLYPVYPSTMPLAVASSMNNITLLTSVSVPQWACQCRPNYSVENFEIMIVASRLDSTAVLE